MTEPRRPDAAARPGFTLLEVLVALSVLAFALTALLPRVGLSTTVLQRAERTERAVELAEANNAAVGTTLAVEDGGSVSGVAEDGLRWATSVCCARAAAGGAAVLVDVTTRVEWGDGRDVALTTRRLLPGAR